MSPDENRTLGLALGGGAALGYAHVGVLGVLESYGVRPDVVAGTSAGAFVAVLYAFGLSPAQIIKRVEKIGWRDLSSVSLNSLGIASNEGLAELVDDAIGEGALLEEADMPVAVVTADIRTGRRVVLTEGPVTDAVRASTAIPGVFTPMEIGDNLLVDGGIVENVPVRAVKELGADTVIAVSLSGVVDFKEPRTLMGVLANAFEIAVDGAEKLELEQADVVIRPDLGGFSHWNTEARHDIMTAGRKAAEEAIPEIRGVLHRKLEVDEDKRRNILQRLLGD